LSLRKPEMKLCLHPQSSLSKVSEHGSNAIPKNFVKRFEVKEPPAPEKSPFVGRGFTTRRRNCWREMKLSAGYEIPPYITAIF
ncbi:MAG: hypothetical protein RMK89_07680, partial [Armatimonadota bacterium]|nr:hypothetical protein [Armatimonadota bacterium]MDW8143325.1 hypothetical protein [Armatimonadota bacterium]